MEFLGVKVLERELQSFVTLEEAKTQLHILHDEENSLINQAMEAAVAYCEGFLRQSLTAQKVVASYARDGRGFAEIFGNSEIEIESIKYFDTEKKLVEIPMESIFLDESMSVARVLMNEPLDANKEILAPIKIKYNLSTPKIKNELIKKAVLIAIDCYFSEPTSPNLSVVDTMLSPFKVSYFL